MTERVLLGPFLTRAEAARRAGVDAAHVRMRVDLLRIGGEHLPEAYFAFQFGHGGVRRDLGAVVLALKGRFDDVAVADWLVRPNRALDGASPLDWLNRGGNRDRVLQAAERCGPLVDDREPPQARPEAASDVPAPAEVASRRRPRRGKHRRRLRPSMQP